MKLSEKIDELNTVAIDGRYECVHEGGYYTLVLWTGPAHVDRINMASAHSERILLAIINIMLD